MSMGKGYGYGYGFIAHIWHRLGSAKRTHLLYRCLLKDKLRSTAPTTYGRMAPVEGATVSVIMSSGFVMVYTCTNTNNGPRAQPRSHKRTSGVSN